MVLLVLLARPVPKVLEALLELESPACPVHKVFQGHLVMRVNLVNLVKRVNLVNLGKRVNQVIKGN